MQTEFQCHTSFRFQREILLYAIFVSLFRQVTNFYFQTVSIIEAPAKY